MRPRSILKKQIRNKIHEWTRENFRISTDQALLDFDVIHNYLTHSYWSPGITRDLVETAAENSVCFGVYEEADSEISQIGYARMVTDFARFAYLADVFILDSHQDRGLGTWMMECIMSCKAFEHVSTFLLFTQDAHGLYRKVGFATPKQYRSIMTHSRERPWYQPQSIRIPANPPWENG